MPATVTLTVTGLDNATEWLATQRGQLPFALSLGLNTMANDVQAQIKAGLGGRFTLRRAAFIQGTVYRRKGTYPAGDFSSKKSLTAAVRINPDRDYLVKHEEGGAKTSDGRLAIPLVRLAGNKSMIIGRGHRYNLRAMPIVPGASAMSIKRPKRGVGSTFYATQTRKAGATIIWESKGARTPPKAIWLLRPGGVPIPPRLGFTETSDRVFASHWANVYGAALDKALATAK